MKITSLLFLSLAFVVGAVSAPSPLAINGVPDCAPSALKTLGDSLGYEASMETWLKACATNNEGTDIEAIMPAWNVVTKGKSELVPVYVIPPLGLKSLDERFTNFRKLCDDNDEIVLQDVRYIWVGLHRDYEGGKERWYPHCAIAVFYPDHVHIINTNSRDSTGAVLEEDFDYKFFFLHTFVVFSARGKLIGVPHRQASF